MRPSDIVVMRPSYEQYLANDDEPIVRFFNTEKVEKLITTPGIWFSRFDKMGDDDMEGTYYELFSPPSLRYSAKQMSKLIEAGRHEHMPLISCWSRPSDDNQRYMWSKFGAEPGSICCHSTVGMLRASLVIDNIPACPVTYYPKAILNERVNGNRPSKMPFYVPNRIEEFIYYSTEFIKREQFSKECEIRFICFGRGGDMKVSGDVGCLIPFKEGARPFTRIIVQQKTDAERVRRLQEMFACPIETSSIASS